MKGFHSILDKLHRFISKYYVNALIKGVLLFLAVGITYWMVILSLEHWLWLGSSGRLVLFICFLLVELLLLYKFILIPLSHLMRMRKGIDERQASRIIGNHFPNVGDRLLNLLDLSQNKSQSELLVASIEQRSNRLQAVNFVQAVSLKDGFSRSKYLLFPLVLLGLVLFSGSWGEFFGSHKRVVQFNKSFERPAPFKFVLVSDSLVAKDSEPLEVKVKTEGDVVPEQINLVLNDNARLMRADDNTFSYRIERPIEGSKFYLEANGWKSKEYMITVKRTPVVADFKMEMVYPKYLNKQSETVSGTGDAIIPEGTKVFWILEGKAVDKMQMMDKDTVVTLAKQEGTFRLQRRLFSTYDYKVLSSNEDMNGQESISYKLDVIRDQYPTINMESRMDSLLPNTMYFKGKLGDDHGLRSLSLVYYPSGKNNRARRMDINIGSGAYQEFFYTFPSGLELESNVKYDLYFEVKDNDAVNGGKSSKSRVFTTKLLRSNALKDKELELKEKSIKGLENTVELFQKQKESLNKLREEQRGGKQIGFEGKEQLQQFLQKQLEQEDLMEKFTKNLKQGIQGSEKNKEYERMLKERLERQEKQARENAKALEELQKIADKIEEEQLKRKLDDLSKKQGSSTRNLEQLLELTKRYYVTEKMNQLSRRLEEDSKRQEQLTGESDKDKAKEEQKELNESFEKIAEELSELKKDNEELKKPMEMNVKEGDKESVKEDQKEALKELQKQNAESGANKSESAQKKQKSAAQKMKQMSEGLQQSASGSSGSQNAEDAEMLRQVLDNLLIFSFKQEGLFENITEINTEVSQFSRMVRDQKELRDLFEHVDDSLFALSLRRPVLSEFVNDRIEDVYYNVDKSLESMVENQLYQGASYQQYVLTATNGLSDFLANVLDNMQQSMSSGQGQGQGSDFQLPDIIKGQQSIGEKMGSSGQGQEQKGEGKEGEKGIQDGDGKEGEGKEQGKEGAKGNKGSKEKGKNGEGKDGDGDGNSNGQGDELGMEELFEIYKQQQRLREGLEEQLSDIIDRDKRGLAQKIVKQMEEFERELLENGITERTKQRALQIEYELLKLKNANIQKGERKERESKTETKEFVNPILTKPDIFKRSGSGVESLNRQALPLQKIYADKVKEYYQND
ncbi:MAG: hypothetical protein AAFU57_04195 [Bacteroidota bacterium]